MVENILVAHEQFVVREGFSSALGQLGYSNLEVAPSAEAAWKVIKDTELKLLIVSYTIPKMGGFELLNRLQNIARNTSTIFLLNHSNGLVAEKCFSAGARGVMSIDVVLQDLEDAIETVTRGEIYACPVISRLITIKSISGSKSALDSLSPREFDVYSKLVKDKPVKDVAKELFLSEKTVANYARIIKKKLGVKTVAGLLRISYEENLSI